MTDNNKKLDHFFYGSLKIADRVTKLSRILRANYVSVEIVIWQRARSLVARFETSAKLTPAYAARADLLMGPIRRRDAIRPRIQWNVRDNHLIRGELILIAFYTSLAPAASRGIYIFF